MHLTGVGRGKKSRTETNSGHDVTHCMSVEYVLFFRLSAVELYGLEVFTGMFNGSCNGFFRYRNS